MSNAAEENRVRGVDNTHHANPDYAAERGYSKEKWRKRNMDDSTSLDLTNMAWNWRIYNQPGVDMSGFPYDFLRQWVCLNDYTRSLDGKIVKLSIRLKSTYPYSDFTMLSPWRSFSRRRLTQSHLSRAPKPVSPQRRLFQREGPFFFRSQSRHQFKLFHSVIMILLVSISNQEDSNVP